MAVTEMLRVGSTVWAVLVVGACGGAPLSLHPTGDDTTGSAEASSGSEVDVDTTTLADRYAHARCAAMFSCPCSPHHYDDPDQCELSVAQLVSNATSDLFANVACVDAVIAQLETAPCETVSELVATVTPCRLFAGAAGLGEPCASVSIGGPFAYSSDCDDDLSCSFGTCIGEGDPPNLPPELPEDAPCGPQIDGRCADGLHCDDAVGQCLPRVSDGGACEELGACVPGSYCAGLADGVGTCLPQIELGAACDPTDVYACAPACLDDGSICEWVDCSGVCEAPSPWVCSGAV